MSLWVDRRGQSVVIGSLLIFTFLILAFSGYQTFIVPSQNQQVEAEHFEETEDQFSTLRSNIVNSIGSEETRSTPVELGTGYPVRQIALNPPPAAGRLATKNPGNVTLNPDDNVCRANGNATTRSLVYTPGYNEYGAPEALGYENRVVSGEFRSGRVDEQRLVRETSGNDRISLFLLNGSVDEYGVNTYSLEVNASRQNTTELTNPNITMPSRFNATTWNNEILTDYSNVTVTSAATDDRVKLNFTGGNYTVSCAVVGLDRDPGFTPPDDSGGGGGGGSGSTAYSVSWESPDGEPGTKSCSADDCTLDESAGSVELTAKTDPKAQGAPVEFSVSDQSVAKVSPGSNNTGVDGKATTTLKGQSNGTAQVFASSSGSGDVINFTIIQGKTLDKGSTIVYEGVKAVEGDNGTTKDLDPGDAQALGPPSEDLTENGTNDLPYVDNSGNLKIVDSDGNKKTLIDGNDDSDPSNDKTLMAVGTWDGSDTSVFYADGSKIYRVDGNGTVTEVAEPDNGADAVLGTGDIDGDGKTELLFAGDSYEVRYLEQDETTGTLGVTAGTSSGGGVGQPHDFDGDGTVRAVIVDGSNNVRILGEAEDDETFGNTSAKKAPVTTADVDGDGESEIVYVRHEGEDNEKIKYIDDPLDDPQIKFLNDKDGDKVDAGNELGVVS